jgi:hypothetical protein
VLQQIQDGASQNEEIQEMDAQDVAAPEEVSAAGEVGSSNQTSTPAVDPSQIITIVTGLPRSGTSMMMQMLVAGGLSPLTDGQREADASNPKGYFEYEKATQLRSDSSWIDEAKGKVVKIVAQLLSELPTETNGKPTHYRIVFMDRDLDEVLASQTTMLDLQGRKGADLERSRLAEVFKEQLQKVHRFIDDRNISCLVVRHAHAIQDPRSVAETVNSFFDNSLDVDAMAAVVDPALHRERARAT